MIWNPKKNFLAQTMERFLNVETPKNQKMDIKTSEKHVKWEKV